MKIRLELTEAQANTFFKEKLINVTGVYLERETIIDTVRDDFIIVYTEPKYKYFLVIVTENPPEL